MNIEKLIKERETKLRTISDVLKTKFDIDDSFQRDLLAPTILDLIVENRVPFYAIAIRWVWMRKFWLVTPILLATIGFGVWFSITAWQAAKYPFTLETSKNGRLNSVGNGNTCISNLCVDSRLAEPINETLNEMKAGDTTTVTADSEVWQIERTDKRFIFTVNRKTK